MVKLSLLYLADLIRAFNGLYYTHSLLYITIQMLTSIVYHAVPLPFTYILFNIMWIYDGLEYSTYIWLVLIALYIIRSSTVHFINNRPIFGIRYQCLYMAEVLFIILYTM